MMYILCFCVYVIVFNLYTSIISVIGVYRSYKRSRFLEEIENDYFFPHEIPASIRKQLYLKKDKTV